MEEERTERVDVEDWGEEAPPKKRSPLIKIAAVVVALAVAGVAVWWFAFSNNPPTASFTAQAFDLRVLVDGTNSTDPDGNIATYTWDWGDGTSETTTGPEVSVVPSPKSHLYDAIDALSAWNEPVPSKETLIRS